MKARPASREQYTFLPMFLPILSAAEVVTAVTVAICAPTIVSRDSSQTKSQADRSVIVVSLPFSETTVTLARPFCRYYSEFALAPG